MKVVDRRRVAHEPCPLRRPRVTDVRNALALHKERPGPRLLRVLGVDPPVDERERLALRGERDARDEQGDSGHPPVLHVCPLKNRIRGGRPPLRSATATRQFSSETSKGSGRLRYFTRALREM